MTINTWPEFFKAVATMRERQKTYFLTKSRAALEDAKLHESIVDQAIKDRTVRSEDEAKQLDLITAGAIQ